MDFKDRYPDFADIEEHIRRAQLERSVAIAHLIADAVDGTLRGLKHLFGALAGLRPAKAPRQALSR